MREPKQLIEECKKHLRNTEQYKHEYKKDIRKLITALEKQLSIHVVSCCVCETPTPEKIHGIIKACTTCNKAIK